MGFGSISLFAVDPRPLLSRIPALKTLILHNPPMKEAVKYFVSFDLAVLESPQNTPSRQSSPLRRPIPLPIELVLSIIEMACYGDSAQSDIHLLKDCALVCKAWSTPAQKLLFRHVTLRTMAACDAFHAAVDPTNYHGRMLGDSVIRLDITLDHNQPFGISQLAFAKTVTLCPNLYELNLSLYGRGAPGYDIVGVPNIARMKRSAPSFDSDTLSLLLQGPQIAALGFNNWSDNQESLAQLLDIFPALTSLSLSGTPPLPPSPLLGPFACSLERLRLNFQKAPSLDFLNWLLHNSTATLRLLEFDRDPTDHVLDHLLTTHGSVLRSLALPSCNTLGQVLAVQKCPQLRELRIDDPVVAPRLFKVTPQSLEHVAIGLGARSQLQSLVQMVRSSDSLTAVTVALRDGGDQHPQLPTLKMACACQGAELRVLKGLSFRSLTRSHPVRAQVYSSM